MRDILVWEQAEGWWVSAAGVKQGPYLSGGFALDIAVTHIQSTLREGSRVRLSVRNRDGVIIAQWPAGGSRSGMPLRCAPDARSAPGRSRDRSATDCTVS
jgi:hypothetical protein